MWPRPGKSSDYITSKESSSTSDPKNSKLNRSLVKLLKRVKTSTVYEYLRPHRGNKKENDWQIYSSQWDDGSNPNREMVQPNPSSLASPITNTLSKAPLTDNNNNNELLEALALAGTKPTRPPTIENPYIVVTNPEGENTRLRVHATASQVHLRDELEKAVRRASFEHKRQIRALQLSAGINGNLNTNTNALTFSGGTAEEEEDEEEEYLLPRGNHLIVPKVEMYAYRRHLEYRYEMMRTIQRRVTQGAWSMDGTALRYYRFCLFEDERLEMGMFVDTPWDSFGRPTLKFPLPRWERGFLIEIFSDQGKWMERLEEGERLGGRSVWGLLPGGWGIGLWHLLLLNDFY